jgi:hypothetical protein
MLKKKDSLSSDNFEERIRNVENTLGIISPMQYPSDMYARLKVVEEKIMRMEELYPQISAHLLNYQDRTDNRLGGRITRAPGFYKELLNCFELRRCLHSRAQFQHQGHIIDCSARQLEINPRWIVVESYLGKSAIHPSETTFDREDNRARARERRKNKQL